MKPTLRSAIAFCVVAFVLSISDIVAQCNSTVAVFQSATTCFGEDLSFMGYATSDCQLPNSVQYTWTATGLDGDNNPVIIDALTASGNVPGYTLIPNFNVPAAFYAELNQVCLAINILDTELNVVSTSQQCLSDFQIPQELTIFTQLTPNWCGDQMCVSNVTVTGGSSPYTITVDGNPTTPNFWVCFDQPGVYDVTVTDANGCVAQSPFIVTQLELSNAICENAVVLQDGVTEQDTLCSLNFDDTNCLGYTYSQQGWYVINSGNATHMNIGFHAGYYGTLMNVPSGMEIYSSPTGQGCADLELQTCYNAQLNGGCFDLADLITIEPNTDYYLLPFVQFTSMSFIEILVVLSDEPIEGICGCTNPTSCNYDPDAMINDGSCGYNGCMDPGACNYLSYATCDDGSCIYGNDITGQVFHDVNGNGIYDYWNNEPQMGTGGYIFIQELGIIIYPDGQGSFVLPELPSAVYHVEYVSNDGLWSLSVDNPVEITLPTCSGLLLPLVPVSEAAAQISGNGWFWNTTLHCTNGFNIGVWVQNTGTVPLSGQFTLDFDPSLSYSDIDYAVDYSSGSAGSVVWDISDQPVGSTYYYMVHINGPGAEEVGNIYPFDMHLVLQDNNDFVFYDEEWTSNATVTCAYDPNDKQAIPEGYADEHFILGNEELEYKVRFQNTGNAPAFDVIIEDQIDISKLDLSTFEPVVASHSYSTIIQPDGLVKFVFNNIMLPDSASDEPGSQGYVVYRIRPLENLIPGDVIENTAQIFFDDNPPIQTNTTFHTIFSCDWIQPDPVSLDLCEGDVLNVDASYEYVETYEWMMDGEMVSNAEILEYVTDDAGTYYFSLTRINPLCNVQDVFEVQVNPNPEATITSDGITLTASDGVSWQWFYLSVPLEDQTDQTATIVGDGFYHVEVTNEFGCTTKSQPFMVVSTNGELSKPRSVLFPNPAQEFTMLSTDLVGAVAQIYDQQGKLVESMLVNSDLYRIDTSKLNSGVYTIVLIGSGQTGLVRMIVE
jgi:uncharacterized repeat protein (TIGR01451 family)